MRPSALDPLFADAQKLPGIGPKLAQTLAEFTGDKIVDLLWHLPSNLIDRQYRPALSDVEDGRIATFEVEIVKHEAPRRRNLPYRITCQNETGFLSLVFFHAKGDWLTRALPFGATRMVSGRVERFRDALQIVHPDHMLSPAELEKLPMIEPVYPLTAGVSAKVLMKAVQAALPKIPSLPEWQQEDWLAKNNWPQWKDALTTAHRPDKLHALDPHHPARARLAYDELLAHQLVLALVRRHRRETSGRQFGGREFAPARDLQQAFLTHLPFELTGSQIDAAADISADMQTPARMLRLLQGDVGSGKTVVAVLAMLQAVANGAQAAIMAPTEILAQQHGETIGPWLDALGIRWALITGRNKGKQRQARLDALANGETQIAIGTHALFQDDIAFQDLGLAVVDEQHRFGVRQRMSLSSKGDGVDVLVMTATPIPRTLTLTAYGDMDVSRMPDKPPGRKPIDTRIFSMDRYQEVADSLKNVLAEGARIYWVCPLVSESELIDLAAAEDRCKDLQKLYGAKVGLVHGQMKAAEKDAVMAQFQAGEISILVATTVIEVGVNVPEATVMIIEHAERFGLSQLHQLRGRVGRGLDKSTCLLIYRAPLGETAKARLQIMRDTEDGFLIAEEDLKLRGAGEVLGTRQSGLPTFRIADLEAHADLLSTVHDDVRLMLSQDPRLETARGQALRTLLYLFRRDEAIRYLQSG